MLPASAFSVAAVVESAFVLFCVVAAVVESVLLSPHPVNIAAAIAVVSTSAINLLFIMKFLLCVC